MTDFTFGTGPQGLWIDTGLGRIDMTEDELTEALERYGIKTTQVIVVSPEEFEPRMTLGWNDCDPVAVCHCGARLVGDSVNDAALVWTKHLTTAHKGEW